MEETVQTTEALTVAYNPDLLVSYKVIKDAAEAAYETDKVRNIEWALHNARRNAESLRKLESKIGGLDEQIIEWSNPNYDKEDVLRELCEYFGINPSREIEFSATFTVSGTISVPFDEIESFDIEWALSDDISIDSNNGNIEITDWTLDHARDLS